MASNDFETIGKNIRDMVEDAVNSQDFDELSQSISQAVNSTVNNISNSINNAGKKVNYRTSYYNSGSNNRVYSSINNQQQRTNNNVTTQNRQNPTTSLTTVNKNNTAIFAKTTGQQIKGILEMAVGYSMLGLMGMSTIGTLAIGSILNLSSELIMGATVSGIFTVGFGLLARAGRKSYSMARRFQTYIQAMNGKEYINIDQLALTVKKNIGYVKKDVEKMIKKRWFVQGHLDTQKSCLMITDKLYGEYKDNLIQSEELKKQEEKILAQKNVSSEVRDILKSGNDYISKIQRCNDLIPGAEMSSKISSIEMLVKRIFDRVEKHPENVSDIKKMMDYYLPTTVKLLEAYVEFDNQPIAGENILNSKKEIEKSLDTLNVAFEKLLDELFKDSAWDVSTDISVLNTILAQDGLTENKDF